MQRGPHYSKILECILANSHEILTRFCTEEFTRVLTLLHDGNTSSTILGYFQQLETEISNICVLLESGSEKEAHERVEVAVRSVIHLRTSGAPEYEIQAKFDILFSKVVELIRNEKSFISSKLKSMASILAAVATDKVTSETFLQHFIQECPIIKNPGSTTVNAEILSSSGISLAFYIRLLIACHMHSTKSSFKIIS